MGLYDKYARAVIGTGCGGMFVLINRPTQLMTLKAVSKKFLGVLKGLFFLSIHFYEIIKRIIEFRKNTYKKRN